MKKVISFSLWGNNSFYVIGAILNVDIAETEWPDWICRFYVAPSVPTSAILELQSRKNVEIIKMNEDISWNGMFWRFYPCSDPTVDVVISRDADSRLSIRDKAAVDEWLNSDKDFHILRDNCQHGWPICGGAWGCRNRILHNMKNMTEQYNLKSTDNNHGIDQKFLSSQIYPYIQGTVFVHDDWFPNSFIHETKHKFPIPRLRGDGWWNTTFPKWHSGIENDVENYPHWSGGTGHCFFLCPACNVHHDNDYIGKQRSVTLKDQNKYKEILKDCN